MTTKNLRNLLATLGLAVACTTEVRELPTVPATLSGRVSDIDRDGERIGTIRVVPSASGNGDTTAVSVTIRQRTLVGTGSGPARDDFNALAVGQWVRVWLDPKEPSSTGEAALAVAIDSMPERR